MEASVERAPWHNEESLQQRMETMLRMELMCDVTFLVGREKTPVRAHKNILCSISPVFFAWFNGSTVNTKDIELPNIDPGTFYMLLKSIYTDQYEINGGNLFTMLCFAENYKLVKLKNVCVGVLNTYINIQGIAFAFPVSVQFSLLNTQINCLKFISDNTEECLQMPGFISLPENCIELILNYKGLSCKEEVLFEYVMKCAVSLCQQNNLEINIKNKRAVLRTLIKYIRFPLMDVTYFTDVSRIGILTQKEVISVFQTIHGNFNGCFSAVKRNSQIKRMVRNVNDAQIIHLTSTQNPPFAICIDVSCSVATILHGIALGCMYNEGKFQCIITHLKVKSLPERKLPIVCPNNQHTVVDILSKLDNLKLGVNDNEQLRDILLKEPVILSKDNWYVIEMLVNNISGSVKSSNRWDSVIDGNIQVMFRKHSEKTENVHPELICGVLVSEK